MRQINMEDGRLGNQQPLGPGIQMGIRHPRKKDTAKHGNTLQHTATHCNRNGMRAKRFRFWCGRDIVVASATLAVHCGCVTGRALWVRTVTASNCSHASYMTRVTYVTHFTHFTHVTQLLMLPKNIKMKGPLST